MKLAWQEAYRLRSCPGDDMLLAEQLTAEITRHLQLCPACSDIRSSAPQSREAWRKLSDKLYDGFVSHRATDVKPEEGQVWALRDDLSHWGSDGNYYQPPHVLLLRTDGNALTVAQTYHDSVLAGDGDIVLTESTYGFAESWNIYTIHREMLAHCRGAVKSDEVRAVQHEAGQPRAELDEDSILYWFRNTEVQVGAEIAVPAVAQVLVELERRSKNEVDLQNIFGTLENLYRKLVNFTRPELSASLLELLVGIRDPQAVMPIIAATSTPLQVNVVIKQSDGSLTLKTVGAILTENNWEDGDYYVAGKLKEAQNEELLLVASLYSGRTIVCEHQRRVDKGSPYFHIIFRSVPKEVCTLKHLRFILVKP